jgi:periplasmic mercuric ion binding protein
MKTVQIVIFFLAATVLAGNATAQSTAKTADIKIKSSVVCGQCKDRIESGLAYEKGVKEVSVDLKTKEVTVKYNPAKTTPEDIRTALSKIGYDADDVKADPKAYAKLPSCCKKDAAAH